MAELARLKRFVAPGVLPPGVVAEFNKDTNLLRIDEQFYLNAPYRIQQQIWRAEASLEIKTKEQ